jgi:hypothetical protein
MPTTGARRGSFSRMTAPPKFILRADADDAA